MLRSRTVAQLNVGMVSTILFMAVVVFCSTVFCFVYGIYGCFTASLYYIIVRWSCEATIKRDKKLNFILCCNFLYGNVLFHKQIFWHACEELLIEYQKIDTIHCLCDACFTAYSLYYLAKIVDNTSTI